MSINQFAMVEELASLVKDNFPCKHLVLSVEEGLVNFLQDDSRPSILVSDILWQSDEPQPPPSSYQILRRKDAPTVLITNVPSSQDTFKEREAAYLAARERIFAFDSQEMREPVTQRPRNVPVVARRMIAHALGQKIGANDQDASVKNSEGYEVGTNGFIVPENDNYTQEPDQNMSEKAKGENHDVCATLTGRKVPKGSVQKYANVPSSRSGRGENVANKEYLKKEHIGAAKRMFAQALGRSSVRDGLHSKGAESNQSSST